MINNEEEYNEALNKLDKILGDDLSNEEEILSLIEDIVDYENIHYPI